MAATISFSSISMDTVGNWPPGIGVRNAHEHPRQPTTSKVKPMAQNVLPSAGHFITEGAERQLWDREAWVDRIPPGWLCDGLEALYGDDSRGRWGEASRGRGGGGGRAAGWCGTG